jgi:cyclopropane fatty-acyl-phospholipid synthase-like methyltransferase
MSLDLGNKAVLEEVGRAQIAYYRERAEWFDDIYDCAGDYDGGDEQNRQWRADLADIEQALAFAPLRGTCVELGIGTAYWTERYIDRVEHLVGLDSSVEMLETARRRLNAHAHKVDLEVTDLWRWKPDRVWDSAVACFFVEHVPDELLPGLLGSLHGALRLGGAVFVAEAAARDPERQVESRDIHDRRFLVVDRPRTPVELADAFRAAGFEVEVAGSLRFLYVVARKH